MGLAGRTYRMTLGECLSNGSTYPILFIDHPSSLRFKRRADQSKIADAITDAVSRTIGGA